VRGQCNNVISPRCSCEAHSCVARPARRLLVVTSFRCHSANAFREPRERGLRHRVRVHVIKAGLLHHHHVRDAAIRVYSECAAYALGRGIIIADTKFELGLDSDGRLVMDEPAPGPPQDSHNEGFAPIPVVVAAGAEHTFVVPLVLRFVGLPAAVLCAVVVGSLWFVAMLRTAEMPGHH
jgi:hypothetical protein